jgi:CBS domain-containing protein
MPETSLPHLVRDLMTVGVVTCTPQTTVNELAQLLLNHDLDDVIVLEDGKALGVVGQDDLIRAFSKEEGRSLTANEVMYEGVHQIPPDIPLTAAAQIMLDLGVRTLFLMHHAGGIEYPAAALSYKHYLRYLAAENHSDLSDLGIEADRQTPLESFIKKREAARQKNLNRDDT